MRSLETPLTVDCADLDSESVEQLADNLRMFFEIVDVYGDEITADEIISPDFAADVRTAIKASGARIAP